MLGKAAVMPSGSRPWCTQSSPSSHLHTHLLAGEPDSYSWAGINILVSEAGDGGSAARAGLRQILDKPRAQRLGQAS
jgi:hypothetical protein